EDRWLYVVPFGELVGSSASRRHLRLLFSDIEIRKHAVILLFAHQRAHFRIAIERRAELDLFSLLSHRIHKLLIDRLLHTNPTASRTDFALVDEHSKKGSVNRGFEIGVSKENIR